MNHSAEITALKEQVAVLTEKLAEHVNPPPPQPEPVPYAGFGPRRNGKGEVVFDPEAAALANAREKERQEAKEAAQLKYRTEGLTAEQIRNGMFWDQCGLLRNHQGKITPIERPKRAADPEPMPAGWKSDADIALENENAARSRGQRPQHDSSRAIDNYNPLDAKV